jgi:hypothetical protein
MIYKATLRDDRVTYLILNIAEDVRVPDIAARQSPDGILR